MKKLISLVLMVVFCVSSTSFAFADDISIPEVLNQIDTIVLDDIKLERPTEDQLKELAKYYMDEDVMCKFYSNDAIKDEEKSFNELKYFNSDGGVSFVIKDNNDNPIGEVILQYGGLNMVNVAYWLGKPFWGHGYVPKACGALMGKVFEKIPDISFCFIIDDDNVKSLKTYEKIMKCLSINKLNCEVIENGAHTLKYKISEVDTDNEKFKLDSYVNGYLMGSQLLTKEQILNITYKKIFDTRELEINKVIYLIKLSQQ